MKRTFAILAVSIGIVAAIENPAHAACTASQTQSYNLAVRAQHMAADISTKAGGERADRAVHALLDLVEAIDRQLAGTTCGR